MIINRSIQPHILKALEQKKVVIIYGPRQVGKTTLAHQIAQQFSAGTEYLYLNCDEPDIEQALHDKTSTQLKNFIGAYSLIVIDEAQRVTNIGLTIKLIHDTFPNVRIIATGSSSFDLANQVSEPLTGRSRVFTLYPLSLQELASQYSDLELQRLIPDLLRYGSYPEIVTTAKAEIEPLLQNLSQNYLYKDVLSFSDIRQPDTIKNLLKALAFQVGNEVSLNELASLIGVDKKTVEKYLQILEQAFIIHRLSPLSKNQRNEISSFRKIYFTDLGMRNSIIGNISELEFRQDVGQLWENFAINERLKFHQAQQQFPNFYFWRNYHGAEIDLVEEYQGCLQAFEFKYNRTSFTKPKAFMEGYHPESCQLVNKEKFRLLMK